MNEISTPGDAPSQETVRLCFDSVALQIAGWAAPAAPAQNDDLVLSLMLGQIRLGTLRRDRARPDVEKHLGYSSGPVGFSAADYGLRLFARLNGLSEPVISVDGVGSPSKHALPPQQDEFRPLQIRRGVGDDLRLADLWLENSRALSLRFEGGASGGKLLDAYQVTPAGEMLCVMNGRTLDGNLALVSMTLLSSFSPVLLVIRGPDEAIDAIDVLPFPSLVRGGWHSPERLICSRGSDDLADVAELSLELASAWLERIASPERCIGAIELDPAVHTGLEPILNADLLTWLSSLRVGVKSGSPNLPDFIAETIGRLGQPVESLGHTLHLPADSIPTIAALVKPLPSDGGAQRLAGGMAIAEFGRQGRVWSVWQPPSAERFAMLKPRGGQRFGPLLSVAGDESGTRELAVEWPLSIAMRLPATRVANTSPFEISAETESPLLDQAPSGAKPVSVLVLLGTTLPLPLLESLGRQEGVQVRNLVVCRPHDEKISRVGDAAKRLFADAKILPMPTSSGRLDQIVSACPHLTEDRVIIVDASTVLPDPRTLTTLIDMLDLPDVASAGCQLRAAGKEMTRLAAGYTFSQIALQCSQAVGFDVIDPSVWREPCTYPVVANTISVLATKRNLLDGLSAAGSSRLRPEVDDLLLGLQLRGGGGFNLCTTAVSAFTNDTAPRRSELAVTLPYRISPEELARIVETSTLVQRVA